MKYKDKINRDYINVYLKNKLKSLNQSVSDLTQYLTLERIILKLNENLYNLGLFLKLL